MKFDVIISNPPYQMADGGNSASAMPIYQKFVEQAKNMNPRYLVMIIPARWYAGGKGLDEFRKTMLTDRRIRRLVDYFDAEECFPGIDISGGICYFLWDRDHTGPCIVDSRRHDNCSVMERELLEAGCDSFIRFNCFYLQNLKENQICLAFLYQKSTLNKSKKFLLNQYRTC